MVRCRAAQPLQVPAGGVARPRPKDGVGGGPAAGHGLGDALALQRVDQAGRVADEQHAVAGRCGAQHAHLQPAAGSCARTRPGQQALMLEVGEEVVQLLAGAAAGGAVGSEGEAEADVHPAPRHRECPAVAGQQAPPSRFPQHDVRKVEVAVQVAAYSEPPQRPCRVHQAGVARDRAGRAVRTQHHVAADGRTAADLDAVDDVAVVRQAGDAAVQGGGPGRHRRVEQQRVELFTGHRDRVIGVVPAG